MTLIAGVLMSGGLVRPTPARAQVFLTQKEALELAFPPPATIERRTAFLDEEDRRRAEKLAGPGIKVDLSVVSYYVGALEHRSLGVAYFDVHRVRTLPEAVMVVVDAQGEVSRVEILKFSEPRDYLASAAWLGQFEGRGLARDLSLKRGIANLTGATLTSRAITAGVRRVLALHEVIAPTLVAAPERPEEPEPTRPDPETSGEQ